MALDLHLAHSLEHLHDLQEEFLSLQGLGEELGVGCGVLVGEVGGDHVVDLVAEVDFFHDFLEGGRGRMGMGVWNVE